MESLDLADSNLYQSNGPSESYRVAYGPSLCPRGMKTFHKTHVGVFPTVSFNSQQTVGKPLMLSRAWRGKLDL